MAKICSKHQPLQKKDINFVGIVYFLYLDNFTTLHFFTRNRMNEIKWVLLHMAQCTLWLNGKHGLSNKLSGTTTTTCQLNLNKDSLKGRSKKEKINKEYSPKNII